MKKNLILVGIAFGLVLVGWLVSRVDLKPDDRMFATAAVACMAMGGLAIVVGCRNGKANQGGFIGACTFVMSALMTLWSHKKGFSFELQMFSLLLSGTGGALVGFLFPKKPAQDSGT